ncbi:MAG: molybdopterin-guanine dinucleotide biosynthesis protein B [Chloroflexi bacterium]|nr:molybdopterin-guanine dinucleotide biosynthesis protein B [Chloroflexota bacterium]
MIPPVLCIVGPSGSGKTLVAERLIAHLASQGYRVAAIKHCPHGYHLDTPGSDSTRLKAAGAVRVALVSPTERAVMERVDGDVALEQIAEQVGDGCDLVLAEGFRASAAPKVLVLRGAPDPAWEFPQGVIAVVSDKPFPGAPWQCGSQEVEALAALVRSQLINGAQTGAQVSLAVDGVPIPLSTFASSILASTLWGMVGSLRGLPAGASRVRLEIQGRPPSQETHR